MQNSMQNAQSCNLQYNSLKTFVSSILNLFNRLKTTNFSEFIPGLS